MPITTTATRIERRATVGTKIWCGGRSGASAFIAGESCAPAVGGAQYTRGKRPVEVEERDLWLMAASHSTEQTRHKIRVSRFSRLNKRVFEENVDEIHRKMEKLLARDPHETAIPNTSSTSRPGTGTSPDAGIPFGPGFGLCQYAGATSPQLKTVPSGYRWFDED
jgi:hypothetical protein